MRFHFGQYSSSDVYQDIAWCKFSDSIDPRQMCLMSATATLSDLFAKNPDSADIIKDFATALISGNINTRFTRHLLKIRKEFVGDSQIVLDALTTKRQNHPRMIKGFNACTDTEKQAFHDLNSQVAVYVHNHPLNEQEFKEHVDKIMLLLTKDIEKALELQQKSFDSERERHKDQSNQHDNQVVPVLNSKDFSEGVLKERSASENRQDQNDTLLIQRNSA